MVELDGFEDAMRAELSTRVVSFGRETIETWAEMIESHLRAATPPGTASQDEWNMEPIIESREIRQRRGEGGQFASGWELVYTAETDDGLNLMDIFEFGTDPYTIEGDPVLRWTDPETGEEVFAAEVEHPGIPAVAAVRITKGRLEAAIGQGEISV